MIRLTGTMTCSTDAAAPVRAALPEHVRRRVGDWWRATGHMGCDVTLSLA